MTTPTSSAFRRPRADRGRARIRLDADGRFWHDGELVAHQGMARAFASWIDRHPDDGRYILTNGFDWSYFKVDDVPFFVRSLRIEGDRAILQLSDGSEEPLDPSTLEVGPRDALYLKVKQGKFDARFTPSAQTALGPLLIEGTDGLPELSLGGRSYPIRQPVRLAPRWAACRPGRGSACPGGTLQVDLGSMRVLVADRLAEGVLDEMRTLGVEVVYAPDTQPVELVRALDGVGVLVVRGTEVSGQAIESAESLNLIIRAGAGVSNIDVHTASERGVYVANCPGKNAAAVAELAFTLVGCLDRRVPDAVSSLRAGRWEKHEYARAVGLRGRRIGIAGLGHVGRAVARLAVAYGLEPRAWSRSLTVARAADLGVARAGSLEELASRSDIFTRAPRACRTHARHRLSRRHRGVARWRDLRQHRA